MNEADEELFLYIDWLLVLCFVFVFSSHRLDTCTWIITSFSAFQGPNHQRQSLEPRNHHQDLPTHQQHQQHPKFLHQNLGCQAGAVDAPTETKPCLKKTSSFLTVKLQLLAIWKINNHPKKSFKKKREKENTECPSFPAFGCIFFRCFFRLKFFGCIFF